MTTNEREIAIREGHKIHAETSYFKPRPQLDFENARHVFCEGFDRGYIAAAKADSEREIAELRASNELLHDALESNNISEKELLSYRVHINVLREALENLHDDIAEYQKLNNIGGYENQCMKQARQALASTPAQPLQAHDDEVIEQVAQDISRIMVNQDWVTWVVDEIRALKGK